jgi:hypothetical protein
VSVNSRLPALVFLLLLALTVTPYVAATLNPPVGSAFVGTFYYSDDFYNYLSYAQQAEDGAFLFQNRVLLEEHGPALVNLEWWLVGRLSALLGGHRLLLAYRLFGVLGALSFVVVADRWLRRLGLREGHRLPALLLLVTGGGLGGLLFTFADRDLKGCLDLYAGLYPYLGLLANPHFVAGTTLLLASLLLFDAARTTRAHLVALAAAWAMALVRPYDLVLLVLIRTISVAVLEPPRRWLSALLPLCGLLPVVLYLYWLFYLNPAFAIYTDAPYVFPPRADFAWALGPATLLAVLGLRSPPSDEARRARVHLAVWGALGLLVVLLRPVNFSLQFLVGLGFPLLALGAFGLGRRGPHLTAIVAALFATSQAAALHFVMTPNPLWLVPRADMELVRALRPTCRSGDVLFAPEAVGVLAYGLTACRAVLSHKVDPGYEERLAQMRSFGALPPRDRAALLDAYLITHFLAPGDAGPKPVAWLGEATAFRRCLVVTDGPVWSLYVRERRPLPGATERSGCHHAPQGER